MVKGVATPASEVLTDEIEVLGIYFSAHWCPPCRRFTPVLSERYTKLKEAGKKTEFLFLSSDQDQEAFDEYHASMPFPALPYSEDEVKEKLSAKYEVRGIPSFVLVNAKTGELITKEGRNIINDSDFLNKFPSIGDGSASEALAPVEKILESINAAARASWSDALLKQFEDHFECADQAYWVDKMKAAIASLDLTKVSSHNWNSVDFASLTVRKEDQWEDQGEEPQQAIWQINPASGLKTGLAIAHSRCCYSTYGCKGYYSDLLLMYEDEEVKVLIKKLSWED
jgi:nucleoredoxin